MDTSHQTIILYSAQANPVLEAIDRDGTCYNKACYIQKKYQEVSEVFLTAYRQFVRYAAPILPPPPEAEFPYWAYENPQDMYSAGLTVLKLEVPLDQVILFDPKEWNRVLQFRYLGLSEKDNQSFQRELDLRGINVWEVMRSNFYPDLRQKILSSWKRLFRNHAALLAGERDEIPSAQAALWQIRREWILERF